MSDSNDPDRESADIDGEAQAASAGDAYIARCGFCGQGLVRLYRCNECSAVIAICDECERLWKDPQTVHADPHAKADGAHPNCPACPNGDVTWTRLPTADLAEGEWADLVAGYST